MGSLDKLVQETNLDLEVISESGSTYLNLSELEKIQRLIQMDLLDESRHSTTSENFNRVATLIIALAETVDKLKTGRFADLSFSTDQLSEIRYASLLHDFGKIGL